jgi:lysophospholipase L1-like esterase
MSELPLLAVSLLTQTQLPATEPPLPLSILPPLPSSNRCQPAIVPDVIPIRIPCPVPMMEFSVRRSLKASSNALTRSVQLVSSGRRRTTSDWAARSVDVNRGDHPEPNHAEPNRAELNRAELDHAKLNRAEPILNAAIASPARPEINRPRPTSGPQMYEQRWAALMAGHTYTRLPVDSFQEQWQTATYQPTYEEWKYLLAQEAQSMARGQGTNRLTVMVGDSISLWFPTDQLSSDRFWLNQGISGDTSAGVLNRLSAFANTRPDTVHVMVGINDLRRGLDDREILGNIRQIMQQLRQQHPDAEIVVHSILPTRLPALPSDRIQSLNQDIAAIAQQEQVGYLDLQTVFSDETGVLQRELTTDGIHLSSQGYAVWRSVLQQLNLA